MKFRRMAVKCSQEGGEIQKEGGEVEKEGGEIGKEGGEIQRDGGEIQKEVKFRRRAVKSRRRGGGEIEKEGGETVFLRIVTQPGHRSLWIAWSANFFSLASLIFFIICMIVFQIVSDIYVTKLIRNSILIATR